MSILSVRNRYQVRCRSNDQLGPANWENREGRMATNSWCDRAGAADRESDQLRARSVIYVSGGRFGVGLWSQFIFSI